MHANFTYMNRCTSYAYMLRWMIDLVIFRQVCNLAMSTLHHTAPHCTTLQHTATHCNTLHHTECATMFVTLRSATPIVAHPTYICMYIEFVLSRWLDGFVRFQRVRNLETSDMNRYPSHVYMHVRVYTHVSFEWMQRCWYNELNESLPRIHGVNTTHSPLLHVMYILFSHARVASHANILIHLLWVMYISMRSHVSAHAGNYT